MGTQFEKTGGGYSAVQGGRGGPLYSERNCNKMAAARGYAVSQREGDFVRHPFKGVARERDMLIIW